MNTGFRNVLLIMMAGLAGCTLWPSKNWESPLSRQVCPHGLSENYEVRATLSLQSTGREEEYFLAVRTVANSVDIALLTLQGIPVYSFHCSASDTDIASQAQLVGGIQSRQLLSYLEMIFIDADKLRPLLAPRWKMDYRDDTRILSQDAAEGAPFDTIEIKYEGAPPWFKSIHLADSIQGTVLDLDIIGSVHVLPE